MGDFGLLGSGGIDGPEGHLPGLGPAVLPGPWVLVCRDVGGVDTGHGCGLQQFSGIELKVFHVRGLQGLHVDHLRVLNPVFDGLELVADRLKLSALLGFQDVGAEDLEALGNRADACVLLHRRVKRDPD